MNDSVNQDQCPWCGSSDVVVGTTERECRACGREFKVKRFSATPAVRVGVGAAWLKLGFFCVGLVPFFLLLFTKGPTTTYLVTAGVCSLLAAAGMYPRNPGMAVFSGVAFFTVAIGLGAFYGCNALFR
jgi:uncharacterized protein (DUF983 family)